MTFDDNINVKAVKTLKYTDRPAEMVNMPSTECKTVFRGLSKGI